MNIKTIILGVDKELPDLILGKELQDYITKVVMDSGLGEPYFLNIVTLY